VQLQKPPSYLLNVVLFVFLSFLTGLAYSGLLFLIRLGYSNRSALNVRSKK